MQLPGGAENGSLSSLPAAIKLSRAVHAFGAPDIDRMIVVKTARFHALFGTLLILGVLIGVFI